LFRIIAELKQRGVAIIYIPHRVDEIFRLADAITVMRDGRRVATRSAAELDEAP
jgi:ABC-type sugar transport system ATPase subunit